MEHCACGVLVKGKRILLGKRSAERRFYPGVWDVFGGHLEPGESVEEALVRELDEELGIVPVTYAKLATLTDPDSETNRHSYHMFVVHSWNSGPPRLQGDEHSEFGWFALEDALTLDLAIDDYRIVFRQILDP